ncbi:hypothetical protein AVEN_20186-1 [Araneus ventricosus]|uniref:Uncharacterized protein n=1 Tax=Araneus ventricosus TaxID=182803 RepID=A0A4Y2CKQ1_ARAVE|nr:hypothetical protein AVEN_20186-1 [Araneus ventricosus]
MCYRWRVLGKWLNLPESNLLPLESFGELVTSVGLKRPTSGVFWRHGLKMLALHGTKLPDQSENSLIVAVNLVVKSYKNQARMRR